MKITEITKEDKKFIDDLMSKDINKQEKFKVLHSNSSLTDKLSIRIFNCIIGGKVFPKAHKFRIVS